MNKSSHDPENGDLIPFDTAGERLLGDIRVLIKSVRARLAQTTNTMLVTLYWNIGRRIKSDILGNERAPYGKEIVYALSRQLTVEYGKQIVQTVSGQLTAEYGRGFRFRNLWMIRKFYLTYKNLNALRAELSWTHYRMLENAEHVELVQLEQNDGWISKKLIKFPLKQIIKATFHNAVLKAHKQLVTGDVSGGT